MSAAPHMVFGVRNGKRYGHMELRDSMWDSLTNLGVGPAPDHVLDELGVHPGPRYQPLHDGDGQVQGGEANRLAQRKNPHLSGIPPDVKQTLKLGSAFCPFVFANCVPIQEDTPTVPMTPAEIAEDVYACWKAGAAVAHLHMRDDKGAGAMNKAKFRQTWCRGCRWRSPCRIGSAGGP